MMANSTRKVSGAQARIELKTTPEVKGLLEQAAMASGVNLTAFIIAQAQEQARRIVAESNTVRLSQQAWAALDEAINNPAPPTAALRALMKR